MNHSIDMAMEAILISISGLYNVNVSNLKNIILLLIMVI